MAGFSLIERALNLRALYHRILAGNIANANTPGYKRKDIDFASEIKREIKASNEVKIAEDREGDEGFHTPDGNTVNLEKEVVKLTENTLMYNTLVQVVVKKFSMMRYLINEGKR
ncbi:MAG: flagellar basal body rod protein FlgB [Deltaproteobacteria bacterium]|nr:flagellar basal body rod protein FlgB [Deltaproteobacteria bacterium]